MSKPNKNASKSPRFFCEDCNAEVPRDAVKCPKCGKSFESVRCTACGFTGEEAFFKTGCPVCGYSASKSYTPKNKKAAGGLPLWVYVLTSAIFTAIMAALFFRFLT